MSFIINRSNIQSTLIFANESVEYENNTVVDIEDQSFFENDISPERTINAFFDELSLKDSANSIESEKAASINSIGEDVHKRKGCQNLVFWKTLSNLYSNMYKISDLPPPTASLITADFIAVGTTKGHILLFNYNEFLILTLVSDPQNEQLQKPIVSIKISNDGTHILAANINGVLVVWNLTKRDHIINDISSQTLESEIHILPKGEEEYVSHLGFLGANNDTIITSYNSTINNTHLYTMFYHIDLTPKKKWLSKETILHVFSKEILFNNPDNGNLLIESLTENIKSSELISAVLTSKSIQLLTFNKHFPLLFIKDLDFHKVSDKDSLCWFKIDSSNWILCFSRGNMLHGLSFEIIENDLKSSNWKLIDEFKYRTSSNITSLQVIGPSLSFVLLENHQLILMNLINGSIIQTSSLTNKDVIMPMNNSIAFSDNRVSLITRKGILLGSFASWQNIILQELRSENPVSAIEFLQEISEHENKALRKLLNVPSFEKDKDSELKNTFSSLVQAILIHFIKRFNNTTDRFSERDIYEISSFFEKTAKIDYYFNGNNLTVCLTIIENASIENNGVLKKYFYLGLESLLTEIQERGTYFPPILVNGMLENLDIFDNCEKLLKNIITFDLSCFNIDLIIKYFIKKKDFLSCISIWIFAINDFETPICDLISCISGSKTASEIFGSVSKSDVSLLKLVLFQFLELIFDGSINEVITDETDISLHTINFLLSASCVKFSINSDKALHTKKENSCEPTFPYFRFLLEIDPNAFIALLRKFFLLNINQRTKECNTILEVFLEILDQYLSMSTVDETLIKLIGLLLSLYLTNDKSNLGIIQNLKLVFQSLTVSTNFKKQSEAALLLLFQIVDFNLLSNDVFTILKRLKFDHVLMYAYFLKKEYLSSLRVALNLESEKIFTLVKVCCDKLKENNNNTFGDAAREDESIFNEDSIEFYELETLLKENFELLCSIDLTKSVELFFLYDFEFEDVVSSLNKSVSNDMLKLKIIDIIIDDSRFQLPFSLYKDYINIVLKLDKEQDYIDEKLDNLLNKESISKHNVETIVGILRKNECFKHSVKLLMNSNNPEEVLSESLHATSSKISSVDIIAEKDIIYFVNFAFKICKNSNNVSMWSTFFLFFFKIHQETSFDDLKKLSLNALMSATVQLSMIYESSNECSLLKVVTNVLENGSVILGKISSCSDLLSDLNFSYTIETSFLKMILKTFNKDAKSLANKYTEAKLKGWLVNITNCSICNSSIHDPTANCNFAFKCGHHFHEKCFKQKQSSNSCYVCNS